VTARRREPVAFPGRSGESRDLSAAQPELVKQLQEDWTRWRKSIGGAMPTRNPGLTHLNDSHAKSQRRKDPEQKKPGKTPCFSKICEFLAMHSSLLCAFAALRESFSVRQFSNASRLF